MARRKATSPGQGAAPGRRRGAGASHYRVFVRDLVVPCIIGIHAHERHLAQRVRLNIDLTVAKSPGPADDIETVVSYEDIVAGAKALAIHGKFGLVETLADEIAALCLADPRVVSARVRAEKLDVFPEAGSVGIEIERRRGAPSAARRAAPARAKRRRT